MFQGLTLVEMAQQVQDQANRKRDFIADTRQLEMNDDGELDVGGGGDGWRGGKPPDHDPSILKYKFRIFSNI